MRRFLKAASFTVIMDFQCRRCEPASMRHNIIGDLESVNNRHHLVFFAHFLRKLVFCGYLKKETYSTERDYIVKNSNILNRTAFILGDLIVEVLCDARSSDLVSR